MMLFQTHGSTKAKSREVRGNILRRDRDGSKQKLQQHHMFDRLPFCFENNNISFNPL